MRSEFVALVNNSGIKDDTNFSLPHEEIIERLALEVPIISHNQTTLVLWYHVWMEL